MVYFDFYALAHALFSLPLPPLSNPLEILQFMMSQGFVRSISVHTQKVHDFLLRPQNYFLRFAHPLFFVLYSFSNFFPLRVIVQKDFIFDF